MDGIHDGFGLLEIFRNERMTVSHSCLPTDPVSSLHSDGVLVDVASGVGRRLGGRALAGTYRHLKDNECLSVPSRAVVCIYMLV